MRQITIETEYITLAAFLKFAGAAMSGGEAKARITAGEVFVNDEICRQRGKKLVAGDRVRMDNDSYEVVQSCT